MKNTIKLRQRRFFSLIMVALLIISMFPSSAFARKYEETVELDSDTNDYCFSPDSIVIGTELYAGDEIIVNQWSDFGTKKITYLKNENEQSGYSISATVSADSISIVEHSIVSLEDINETAGFGYSDDEVAAFKCWRIVYLELDCGCVYDFYVVPVFYATSDIVYNVDNTKGTNPSTNPLFYCETKGTIDIEDAATNDGYIFDGWFTDAGFENEFTGISADTIGDIELYAKFSEVTVEPENPVEPEEPVETEDPTESEEDENGTTEIVPDNNDVPDISSDDTNIDNKDDLTDSSIDNTSNSSDSKDKITDNNEDASPATGDNTPLTLLFVIAGVAALGMVVAVYLKIKQKKEE